MSVLYALTTCDLFKIHPTLRLSVLYNRDRVNCYQNQHKPIVISILERRVALPTQLDMGLCSYHARTISVGGPHYLRTISVPFPYYFRTIYVPFPYHFRTISVQIRALRTISVLFPYYFRTIPVLFPYDFGVNSLPPPAPS